MSILTVSDTNPNDVTGGGGCIVCGSIKDPDQRGPFVIVSNDNEMESNVSPHVVLCQTCIADATAALSKEVLSAGEVMDVEGEEITDDGEVPNV